MYAFLTTETNFGAKKQMDEMIVFFTDSDFKGVSFTVEKNLPNMPDFLNNKITSARVIRGTWQVFSDSNYGGDSVTLKPGDYPNLERSPGGIRNDSISSARIVR